MRRVLGRILGPLALGVAASTCGLYDIEEDEPCRQVGYSIASRTFACTGDGDLANARYEQFASKFQCISGDVTADSFHCSRTISALTCDQVAQNGDEMDRWISPAPRCVRLLRASGSDQPILPDSVPLDGMASDPECWQIVREVALARAACDPSSAGQFNEMLSRSLVDLEALYTCKDPDLNNLAPGSPKDAALLLVGCLQGVSADAGKLGAAACQNPDAAWYRSTISACQYLFLQPR